MRKLSLKVLFSGSVLLATWLHTDRALAQKFVGLEDFNTSNGDYTVESSNTAPAAEPWAHSLSTGTWSTHDQSACAPAFRSSRLNSPILTVTSPGTVRVTFVHRHSFEADTTRWDGGQLRISVNSGDYVEVPLENFTLNGYNNTVGGASVPNNDLRGLYAFTGDSDGYADNSFITSVATLGEFNAEDTISIQFFAAWDDCTEGSEPNWEIDSVEFDPPLEDRKSPPVFPNGGEPADADVYEKTPHTLQVAVEGVPAPTFQWFFNSQPLAGATNKTFEITSMSSTNAGTYFLRAMNSQGTNDSRTATINFVPDLTPPAIVEAYQIDATTVLLIFDENLDPAFADNTAFGVFPEGTEILPDDFIAFVEGNLIAQTVSITNNLMYWGLQDPIADNIDYFVVVDAFSVRDNAEAKNPIADRAQVLLGRQYIVNVISYDGAWSYNQNVHHTNATAPAYITSGEWKDPGFDAAANGWPQGPGMFGTEANRSEIQTRWVTTAAGGPFTVYAVTTFVIEDVSQVRELTLNYRYDDGCVVYLNGVEVIRKGVPVNQTYQTTASSHESDTIATDVLTGFVTGVNTLAVEVHQTGEGSSDIVWGAELIGNFRSVSILPVEITGQPQSLAVDEGENASFNVQATGGGLSYQWKKNGENIDGATESTLTLSKVTLGDAGDYTCEVDNADPGGPVLSDSATLTVNPVLLTRHHGWSYEQSNTDLADGWEAEGFDDGSWSTGPAPLGIETSGAGMADIQDNGTLLLLTFTGQTAQTTTYYFRTHFNFTDDPVSNALELTPEIDDGAIFYLNGVEVLNLGLDQTDPEDPHAHATLASRTIGDGGPEAPVVITSSALKSGDNVLAVEVHQSSATSSDVWMAVKLKSVPAPAQLTIVNLGDGQVEISWTGPAGCVLEESDTVDGTFSPVAGNPSSGVTIATTGQKFYRLSCP